MSKPKAPKAPDPRETSAAQTGTNIGTAISNAFMGNVDQVTPDGTLNYDQTGTYKYTDPYTGQSYDIPKFTATQTLSPQQQATNDQNQQAQFNLASIGNNQSAFLNDYLSKPVDLNNEATEARLFELGSKRLDPRFAREDEALRTRLANQGIQEGSAAYDAAYNNFGQSKNDAYNQLLLTGRGQATQEALTERNQPINEISALLSGSQVSQPSFVNAQMPQIPTTDNAGLIQQGFQNEMGAYQQKNAQRQSLLGGMFGLGSSLIMASDRRLKTDIKKVGEVDGEKVYRYRYKAGGPMRLGVMAQDIEKKQPDAVLTMADGHKAVDYGKVFGLGAA